MVGSDLPEPATLFRGGVVRFLEGVVVFGVDCRTAFVDGVVGFLEGVVVSGVDCRAASRTDVLLARRLLGDYFILADSTCCTTEMLFQHPFVEGDHNGSVVLVI